MPWGRNRCFEGGLMSDRRRMRSVGVFGIWAMCLMFTAVACSEPEVEPVEETTAATSAQVGAGGSDIEPVNDRPNPYETIEDYFTLPEGRTWGATSAVAAAPTPSAAVAPNPRAVGSPWTPRKVPTR